MPRDSNYSRESQKTETQPATNTPTTYSRRANAGQHGRPVCSYLQGDPTGKVTAPVRVSCAQSKHPMEEYAVTRPGSIQRTRVVVDVCLRV